MPKYEITPPFQADEDGSFLSFTLEQHARQKRETEEPRFWFYNVKAFGMSLNLNLTKNEQLMAPGMKVERHFNGTVTSEDSPKNSFLNGHVSSLPGSSVAVSNEDGLVSTELHFLFACFVFCFSFHSIRLVNILRQATRNKKLLLINKYAFDTTYRNLAQPTPK